MTRVLFWNIENFSRNKVANPIINKPQKGSAISRQEASQQRLAYILTHAMINPAPDIIVVVEIETTWYGEPSRGTLVAPNGIAGCRVILDNLRAAGGIGPAWMMVPPLCSGKQEGVAVFYNSTRLAFTGPYIWPGNEAGPAIQPDPDADIGPYPDDLADALPADPVPEGALYNEGTPQHFLAARATGFQQVGAMDIEGAPPPTIDFGSRRAPYMVCFGEVGADGKIARNITLFAIHSPASHHTAITYLSNTLPSVQEIVQDNALNEVRVLAGDFNVNVIHGSAGPDYLRFNDAYQNLINLDYNLGLIPNAADPPDPADGYPGFFATHIKSSKGAKFLSTNATPLYYPGYGYIGADSGNYFAIDNFFVRSNPVSVPAGMTVLNGTVGSPFNQCLPQPPPGNPPIGTVAFAKAMPDFVLANPAPAFDIGVNSTLRGWDNYGKLRSTSDHFAIVIDV